MRQVRQGSSPKHVNTTYKPVDAMGHLQTAENYRQRSFNSYDTQAETARSRLITYPHPQKKMWCGNNTFYDKNTIVYKSND